MHLMVTSCLTAAGIYEGNYVDGKKSGHGAFTWIDGSRYEVCGVGLRV